MLDYHHSEIVMQDLVAVAHEQMRPSTLYRPEIRLSDNCWQARYGDTIGMGLSPAEAFLNFDKNWHAKIK